MKANYTKPLLTVELLTLAQSVARDCADNSIPKGQINGNDPNHCYWDMGGGSKVFVSGTECNIDGEALGYGCYNNPTEATYIFRS